MLSGSTPERSSGTAPVAQELIKSRFGSFFIRVTTPYDPASKLFPVLHALAEKAAEPGAVATPQLFNELYADALA